VGLSPSHFCVFFFFFFWLPAVLLLFSDVNNKHLQVEKTADTRQVPNCATAIIGRENARVRAPHDNNNNKPRSIGVVVPVVVVEDNHNTMATILSVVSASNYYRILRLSMICKDLRKGRISSCCSIPLQKHRLTGRISQRRLQLLPHLFCMDEVLDALRNCIFKHIAMISAQ
jgi:hypothetical protein